MQKGKEMTCTTKELSIRVVLFTAWLAFLLTTPAAAEEWVLDAAHSKIVFTAEARFFSADGQFRKFNVKADVDDKALENSKVMVTVDVASIDTNNERRDKHLRSKDFFDVANHSTATINIKGIRKLSDTSFEADGEITIRGVTKPIQLPVRILLFENGILRFRGSVEMNRKDFGVSYNSRLNPIHDIVGVRYEVNLRKPKPAPAQ